ncbi:MAG: nuclear transport factor 2 family protein [Verrucomicrobiaceae bacterium]|nr:MAG: nuclear transport factor 2 family protein [Verrucomicrobiaceae bacterium]
MIDPDNVRQWSGAVTPASAHELADRLAVSQLVKVYALGVDMRDTELAVSPFAPGAVVEGNLGTFPASEYVPNACAGAAAFSSTQHNITNQHVTIDGDDALVWSYAIAYHMWERPELGEDLIMGVQYRDTCRRVDGSWQIVHRKVANQWKKGPMPG